MTLKELWKPILSPVVGPLLETFGAGSSGATGSPTNYTLTLPNSYSTKTNDCIVLAVNDAGGGGTWSSPAVSGCGATWDVSTFVPAATGPSSPALLLAVGYGCTAGGTTVTFGTLPAFTEGVWALGVWSGLRHASNPILASSTGTSGSGIGLRVSTGSVSYSADNLLVGAGGGQEPAWPANDSGWGDGGFDLFVANATDSTSAAYMSYRQIPPVSGSTTYFPASNISGGFTSQVRSAVVVLAAA